jgi:hypothetical protein
MQQVSDGVTFGPFSSQRRASAWKAAAPPLPCSCTNGYWRCAVSIALRCRGETRAPEARGVRHKRGRVICLQPQTRKDSLPESLLSDVKVVGHLCRLGTHQRHCVPEIRTCVGQRASDVWLSAVGAAQVRRHHRRSIPPSTGANSGNAESRHSSRRRDRRGELGTRRERCDRALR